MLRVGKKRHSPKTPDNSQFKKLQSEGLEGGGALDSPFDMIPKFPSILEGGGGGGALPGLHQGI